MEPFRVNWLTGNVMVMLFYQPSTRTRMSFETAMARLGGIQELYGVVPDLVALGKALAGGYPIGAFAGRRDIMERVAPTGDPSYDSENVAYHSGTNNSNPVAMTAVKATVQKLIREDVYPLINGHGETIRSGIEKSMQANGFEGIATGMGSLVQCHFGVSGKILRPEELTGRDLGLQKRFHSLMVNNSVVFNPGPKGTAKCDGTDL